MPEARSGKFTLMTPDKDQSDPASLRRPVLATERDRRRSGDERYPTYPEIGGTTHGSLVRRDIFPRRVPHHASSIAVGERTRKRPEQMPPFRSERQALKGLLEPGDFPRTGSWSRSTLTAGIYSAARHA